MNSARTSLLMSGEGQQGDKRARTAESNVALTESEIAARSKFSNQVQQGLKRRDANSVQATFESHKDPATLSIMQ